MSFTNKLKTYATVAKNKAILAFADPSKRRMMIRGAVAVMALCACMTATAGATTVAASMGANARGWIMFGLRLFGGCLAIGGITVSITGFTGRDEGVEKVLKIGTGLLLIALGVYILASPNTVLSAMGIDPDDIFSAAD